MPEPDRQFADPRLAACYDPLDPDRGDLEVYAALAEELGARRVLDVGCGTGSLACLLAGRGYEVIGLDPAAASLAVARGKPAAERVRWLHGYPDELPPLQVDLATMTGNVAQVFLGDEEWLLTLRSVRAALRPGGHLVFETRRPSRQAWREWTPERTGHHAQLPGLGAVESWAELLGVDGELVTFRASFSFESDGAVLTSDSTLRFRTQEEVEASLRLAGLDLQEIREAPDRPGAELVFLCTRAS